jgi:hypothetical protein
MTACEQLHLGKSAVATQFYRFSGARARTYLEIFVVDILKHK